MFNGSALTNAIHVVMGLDIGGRDFTKIIGETIAMSGEMIVQAQLQEVLPEQ